MAPPSGGGVFAGRHGVNAEPALPPRSRAGPLWRRRRSLPNSAGPSSKERQGVNPLLAPSAFPMIFLKNSWAAKVPPAQDDSQFIAHDYGAVMAVSAGYFNTIEDLGFFKNDRTDIRIFQTQHTRQVVAVEWSVGLPASCRCSRPRRRTRCCPSSTGGRKSCGR